MRGVLGEALPDKFFQHSLAGAGRKRNRSVGEDQACASIRRRIISIRECSGAQVSKNVGVVGPGLSVVAPGDERVTQRMEEPRFFRAGSLIKVTRILVEQ